LTVFLFSHIMTTMTDAYKILGVARDATDDQIKKAYRSMASKHHPDKGGDTAKFQEVSSAYETLSDPNKRHLHDNPQQFDRGARSGPDNFEFSFNAGGDVNDIFSQFFSQRGSNPSQQHQPQQRRNKDLRINITITLADTLMVQKKTVSVTTTSQSKFNVDVTIPQGVANGTTIKYAQLGDNFFESLTRGDLYVIISVTADSRFDIHGINLVANLEITSIEAMTGTEKEVNGIDGSTFLIKIPAGCQFGTKFGLQGKGLYQMNTQHRGDLIVNTIIKTPILTEAQLVILKTI
jgi:curved DNA-binding protein